MSDEHTPQDQIQHNHNATARRRQQQQNAPFTPLPGGAATAQSKLMTKEAKSGRNEDLYHSAREYQLAKTAWEGQEKQKNRQRDEIECSFKPKLSKRAASLNRPRSLSPRHRYPAEERQKQQRLQKRRIEIALKEMEGCTFQPLTLRAASLSPFALSRDGKIHEALHRVARVKQQWEKEVGPEALEALQDRIRQSEMYAAEEYGQEHGVDLHKKLPQKEIQQIVERLLNPALAQQQQRRSRSQGSRGSSRSRSPADSEKPPLAPPQQGAAADEDNDEYDADGLPRSDAYLRRLLASEDARRFTHQPQINPSSEYFAMKRRIEMGDPNDVVERLSTAGARRQQARADAERLTGPSQEDHNDQQQPVEAQVEVDGEPDVENAPPTAAVRGSRRRPSAHAPRNKNRENNDSKFQPSVSVASKAMSDAVREERIKEIWISIQIAVGTLRKAATTQQQEQQEQEAPPRQQRVDEDGGDDVEEEDEVLPHEIPLIEIAAALPYLFNDPGDSQEILDALYKVRDCDEFDGDLFMTALLKEIQRTGPKSYARRKSSPRERAVQHKEDADALARAKGTGRIANAPAMQTPRASSARASRRQSSAELAEKHEAKKKTASEWVQDYENREERHRQRLEQRRAEQAKREQQKGSASNNDDKDVLTEEHTFKPAINKNPFPVSDDYHERQLHRHLHCVAAADDDAHQQVYRPHSAAAGHFHHHEDDPRTPIRTNLVRTKGLGAVEAVPVSSPVSSPSAAIPVPSTTHRSGSSVGRPRRFAAPSQDQQQLSPSRHSSHHHLYADSHSAMNNKPRVIMSVPNHPNKIVIPRRSKDHDPTHVRQKESVAEIESRGGSEALREAGRDLMKQQMHAATRKRVLTKA